MWLIGGVQLALFLLAASSLAQPRNAAKSLQVYPDRRITFRLDAPNASEVKLWGDWITRFNTTEALTKNEAGIWAVTVGPLSPGKHSYLFIVDQLVAPDPSNAAVAVNAEGFEANLIDVSGNASLPAEQRDVPHGAVHMHWYKSSVGLGERRFLVYTPPNYAAKRGDRYPLLLLLHGSGGTEADWTNIGSANFIADNLLKEKLMRPMLIVMPDDGKEAPTDRNTDRVEQDLLRDVIPAVESLYRVERGARHRAIAGESMGGYQALAYGLRHTETFGNIGVFSAGAHGAEGRNQVMEAVAAGKLKRFGLFWIGIGGKDPLPADAQALADALTQHNIRHQYVVTPDAGHTWLFWRGCLAEFLPLLFQ